MQIVAQCRHTAVPDCVQARRGTVGLWLLKCVPPEQYLQLRLRGFDYTKTVSKQGYKKSYQFILKLD